MKRLQRFQVLFLFFTVKLPGKVSVLQLWGCDAADLTSYERLSSERKGAQTFEDFVIITG